MKEELAKKLRESNFLSVMADGGVDFAIFEDVLMCVCGALTRMLANLLMST